jgi:hypothetical protein
MLATSYRPGGPAKTLRKAPQIDSGASSPLGAWRERRNRDIAFLASQGRSVRHLGDVFDLDPGHVTRIIHRTRETYGSN